MNIADSNYSEWVTVPHESLRNLFEEKGFVDELGVTQSSSSHGISVETDHKTNKYKQILKYIVVQLTAFNHKVSEKKHNRSRV